MFKKKTLGRKKLNELSWNQNKSQGYSAKKTFVNGLYLIGTDWNN